MDALVIDGPRSRPRTRDVAAPAAGPGELLVAVRTSAVTGVDLAVVDGRMLGRAEHAFPVTLGRSFAGVVEEVGGELRGWTPGDRVFGLVLDPVVGRGTWAERIAVAPGAGVARTPDGVDDAAAGALGLTGVVAMNLVAATRAAPGHVVLVDGDVLGLAPLVVALAAARGARVIATGGPDDEALLRARGAAEVLDPGGDVVEAVLGAHPEGVHGLVDLVDRGHDGFKAAIAVLRRGGHAVSAFGAATGSGRPDLDVTNVFLEPVPGQLDELAAMAADGRLVVDVAGVVPLADLAGDPAARLPDRRGAVVVAVTAP
jgi:NADPH:quinone reductase-like Zn-dependent oxidoreductase